jgi:hypothetical protein
MSQATSDIRFAPDYVIPPVKVDPKLVTMDGGGKMVSRALLFTGAVALFVTGIVAVASETSGTHALVSYLVGFAVAVGLGLGSLGYVMIFQQTNAGWSTSLRRVAEVVASCIPVCAVLFLPIAFFAGDIYHWRHADGDPILEKKAEFLNVGFWYVRSILYLGLWSFLGWKLLSYSRQQDTTHDKWLTAKARRLSAPGLLLYALSTAFAAFDWLMSLDFHWFSTMFGVYYFAGAIQSATALCILIVGFLKLRGKFGNLVTAEHFHDIGKLLLAFTVFWAYIAFSQYFLIWYSNLPEETHWFAVRQTNGWENVGYLLAFGRFLVPFLFLLWTGTKRIVQLLMLVAAWQLFMQVVDIFYIARPSIEGHTGIHFGFVDIIGPIGPIAIFLGIVVRRLGSMPLVPVGDPRLAEAAHHKNYV